MLSGIQGAAILRHKWHKCHWCIVGKAKAWQRPRSLW